MNENNKTPIYIAVALIVAVLVIAVGGNFFIDKVADRVIKKLEKPYSPSPYGPGLDPDKIDLTGQKALPQAQPQKVLQPWDKN